MGSLIHLESRQDKGWFGEVNTFNDLPPAFENEGKTYLVKQKQGSQLTFNLKRSGFYQSDGANWNKISTVQFMFSDDELTFKDDADFTKQLGFQLQNITSGARRIATFQDKDGTVAYISDLFPEAPNDGGLYLRNGLLSEWQKLFGFCESFDLASKENNQNANNGMFYGIFRVLTTGSYNLFSTQITNISISVGESYTLRAAIYNSSTEQLIVKGSVLIDDNTLPEGIIFSLEQEIHISSPTGVYLVLGVNDEVGSPSLKIARTNANQLGDVNAAFSFQQSSGDLPSILPVRVVESNVLHLISYGQ